MYLGRRDRHNEASNGDRQDVIRKYLSTLLQDLPRIARLPVSTTIVDGGQSRQTEAGMEVRNISQSLVLMLTIS